MWPFKSNIPRLVQITTENDGNTITVVLSKGATINVEHAHNFSKEEVLDLRLTSDVFSPKIIRSYDGRYFSGNTLPIRWNEHVFDRISEEVKSSNQAIKLIVFLLFGGFLNLFILYFSSLIFYKGWYDLLLIAKSIALALICTISVYLFLCYLLKCFRVTKRKNHPELDLYFEDIVTISLNNCVIQFRMTGWDLDYFYDTRLDFPGKDVTTFGFLVNNRKKLVEKEDSWLEFFGFLFFLASGFAALYFFWETPFWFYTIVENLAEFKTSPFYQSHESIFQFSNYYQSNDISFLRAFFDGMVSNLILSLLATGIMIGLIGLMVGMFIGFYSMLSLIFMFLCVDVIIIQIFAYLSLNSKLHRFLSNGEKFVAKLSVGLIISLLLALLSIYLGSVYWEAILETIKPGGARFFFLLLPLSTYYLLQFFLRNTAFAKKSRNGVDQLSKSGLKILLFPLLFIAPLLDIYGIDAKETE